MLVARLPGFGEGTLFTLACVIVFALCLLGATLSWYVLERPLLSLKRYFAYG